MINVSIKALNIQWMNFLNAQNPTENEHRKFALLASLILWTEKDKISM